MCTETPSARAVESNARRVILDQMEEIVRLRALCGQAYEALAEGGHPFLRKKLALAVLGESDHLFEVPASSGER